VEVVRYAAGELADRFQPLGLRELFAHLLECALRLAPLGGVAGDLGEADQPAALVADRLDDRARPEPAAVLAHPPALGLVAALGGGEDEPAPRQPRRAVLIGVEAGEVLAEDLVRRVALDSP